MHEIFEDNFYAKEAFIQYPNILKSALLIKTGPFFAYNRITIIEVKYDKYDKI
jgi:hypothetical protein